MARNKQEVPVFLLNGFLESGKTTFIKEIVENNEYYHNNSTVFICCEQCEVEYDEEWCNKYQIHV
jgi:G3E family GTPase